MGHAAYVECLVELLLGEVAVVDEPHLEHDLLDGLLLREGGAGSAVGLSRRDGAEVPPVAEVEVERDAVALQDPPESGGVGAGVAPVPVGVGFVPVRAGNCLAGPEADPRCPLGEARLRGEPSQDGQGREIPKASIDLVNSCGAVGHHFRADSTLILAREIARVLKPGGIALIDSGRDGTRADDLIRIFTQLGFEAVSYNRSCAVDRFTQFCFRKTRA